MELRPYEYRDPGQVLAAVTANRALSEGDMLLTLVREPAGDQQALRTIRLDNNDSLAMNPQDGPGILAQYVQRLAVPSRRPGDPPRHSVMTIIARRGLAVFGPAEAECMGAWRYYGHLIDAFIGDLMVVTEYGWADFMSGLGGHEPRLAPEGAVTRAQREPS